MRGCPSLKQDMAVDHKRTFQIFSFFFTPEMGVRPYNHEKDGHLVKMLVGQGVMEGLATANKNCMLDRAKAELRLQSRGIPSSSLSGSQPALCSTNTWDGPRTSAQVQE